MLPLGLTVPPIPTILGTWKSSEARRPLWAKQDKHTPHWVYRGEIESARAESEASLLICETDKLFGSKDEVVTHVEMEKEPTTRRPVFSWQPIGIHSNWHFYTIFPLLSVKTGGKVKLVYTDERGSPLVRLSVQRKGMDVETTASPEMKNPPKCTFAERKTVEAAFVSAWSTAVDTLDSIPEKPIKYRPDEAPIRPAEDPIAAAKVQIADCALLVGWDDPRVIDLVRRFWREENRYREAGGITTPAQAPSD